VVLISLLAVVCQSSKESAQDKVIDQALSRPKSYFKAYIKKPTGKNGLEYYLRAMDLLTNPGVVKIAGAVTLLQSSDTDSVEANISADGFVFVREWRFNDAHDIARLYSRPFDGAGLRWEQYTFATPYSSSSFRSAFQIGSGGDIPAGSLSAVPFGDFSCNEVYGGGLMLKAVAGLSYAEAKVTYRSLTADQRQAVESGDRELLEGIVRDRLSSLLSAGFGQPTESSTTSTMSLSDLQRNRHWNYKISDRAQTATVRAGNKAILIPLASKKICIDGKWIDCGGFVLRSGNDWLLPSAAVTAIERAVGKKP
jgi:hypothetical protein